MEVQADGNWGTICDDHWDIKDAHVVCQMLGFRGAKKAPRGAHFGEGNGDIMLDEVDCTGVETSIFDCGHNELYIHDCKHNEDASVMCDPGKCNTKYL